MRRALDALYDGAAWLAALFMIGLLAMVLLSIVSRQLHFHVPGTDAYAGYLMAAAGFLALAHTLQARRAHPRHAAAVGAQRHAAAGAGDLGTGRRQRRWPCCSPATPAAWPGSRTLFNDISTGNDATPLWIPQLAMAAGTVILAIAFSTNWCSNCAAAPHR